MWKTSSLPPSGCSPKSSTAASRNSIECDKDPPSTTSSSEECLVASKAPDVTWKPQTLRAPLLLSIAGFAALLIVTLEYLSRLSIRDGGVAFSNTKFPGYITFAYVYAPTLIAVSLSMLWSWIDLDARRLEPYFRLSRPGGATWEESLELQYPFDYVAWASWKALRKKHWSVVFASFAMMTMFWAVTPILSAVFSFNTVSHTVHVTANTSSTLVPLTDQLSVLSSDFMMSGYETLWVGEALPAFVTREAAVTPFAIDPNDDLHLDNANVTSIATMYTTSLSCKPAVVGHGSTLDEQTYSNEDGCIERGNIPPSLAKAFTALYIGYYEGEYNDYSLSGMGCNSSKFLGQHTFLALFNTKDHGERPTALFCKPSYWQQEVNVTVLAANGSILAISPSQAALPLTEAEFNNTEFEYILINGAPSGHRRDDIPQNTPSIDSRLSMQTMGFGSEILSTGMVGYTGMVTYALGATRLPLDRYMDPDILASAFEKAHKLLFALAMHSLLHVNGSATITRSATLRGDNKGVVVVRTLALVAEVSLGVIIVLAFAFWYTNRRRTISLQEDPAAIGDILSVIRKESSDGERTEDLISDSTQAKLDHCRLRLFSNRQVRSSALSNSQDSLILRNRPAPRAAANAAAENLKTVRPFEMRLGVAIVFIAVLVIVLALVISLQALMHRRQGLPIPSNNPVILQLLTNYLPVFFATFLEPFWTLLNRTLCVLKPFDVLQRGDAISSEAIYLKYSSLPPQLVIWRALKARHFILSIVCAVGLSTNVLSVAMSALFETDSAVIASNAIFEARYLPIVNKTLQLVATDTMPSSEPFYIAKSNITDMTLLPSWTTKDRYFLPFYLDEGNETSQDTSYKALTTGFGASLHCHEVTPDPLPFIYDAAIKEATTNETVWRIPIGNGQTCIATSGVTGFGNSTVAAAEVITSLTNSTSAIDAAEDCNMLLLAGFLRANISFLPISEDLELESDLRYDAPGIRSINSLQSMWMVCEPELLVAPFEVTISSDGHIQDAIRRGDDAQDYSPYFNKTMNVSKFLSEIGTTWTTSDHTSAVWHEDVFVDSWFGYFVKALSNTTDLIDPVKPVPSFSKLSPLVEEAYTRVFSIILSLGTDHFQIAPSGSIVEGSVLTKQDRLYMSKPAFTIVVTLLSLNIAVALLYYIHRPRKMLRRMPLTIASVIELFEGSGLVYEVDKDGRIDNDMKIGYGRFVGTDGKPHLGIERRPYVIPWAGH